MRLPTTTFAGRMLNIDKHSITIIITLRRKWLDILIVLLHTRTPSDTHETRAARAPPI